MAWTLAVRGARPGVYLVKTSPNRRVRKVLAAIKHRTEKQVYTEESSFEDLIKEAEAQESYVEPQEDSSFEDLIKELERSSKRTESVL